MLRRQTRDSGYRQIRMDLAEIGTIEDKAARERARKINLQKIVNMGEKAKAAKEILDIFMDGVENTVLNGLAATSDPEKLLQIKMYYKACLMLEKEFTGMITEALVKSRTLEELNKRKGEEKNG